MTATQALEKQAAGAQVGIVAAVIGWEIAACRAAEDREIQALSEAVPAAALAAAAHAAHRVCAAPEEEAEDEAVEEADAGSICWRKEESHEDHR